MNESKERGLSLHVCAALVLATILQVRSLLISLPQDVAAEAAAAQAANSSNQIVPEHLACTAGERNDRGTTPLTRGVEMSSAIEPLAHQTTTAFRTR